MKKYICLLILLFVINICYGKWPGIQISYNDLEPRYLLSSGLGINSTNYIFKGTDISPVMYLKEFENEGSMALLSMSAIRKISDHAYLGLALAVDQQHGEWLSNFTHGSLFNMQHIDIGVFNRTCVTTAVEYRYNHFVKKRFLLYVTVGAGVTYYHEIRQYTPKYYLQGYYNGENKYGAKLRNVSNSCYFNGYFSPFGIMYGPKKIKGFFELGMGYKGFLHGGVTYSL